MKEIPFFPKNYADIAKYICSGGIAILPTDTIPGFSGDPNNTDVVLQISKLKKRSLKNPFLLLVPDFFTAEKLCEFSDASRRLVSVFWPGPLTLILPRKKKVLPNFFSKENELAIRIPGDENVRKLLHIFEIPLISTSVNISGAAPLTSHDEIYEIFGKENILLSLPKISEKKIISGSTIVRVEGKKITLLRSGAIPEHDILRTQ